MYWQEETDQERYAVPDDVMDLLFSVRCPTLPVDHAWNLSEQIRQVLPWFANESVAGLHLIHGADSGNGWERPEGADQLLHLSRRTKLTLRWPNHRLRDAEQLSGRVLNVAGHSMEVGESKPRPLSMTNIVYARYVVTGHDQSEEEFIEWAVETLNSKRVKFKKILCGKQTELATPNGPLKTRSLMVANLSQEDAVVLQQEGIGPHRSLGCGLFIPQKSF